MHHNVRSSETVHPPRWTEGLLRVFLRPDQAETAFGDLLETYRDSIVPQRGRLRADLWLAFQVTVYILRLGTITPRQCLFGGSVLLFWLLAVVFGGGITLLATLTGMAVTLATIPILLVLKNRRVFAIQVLAVWGCYLCFYILVSTGMAVYAYYFDHAPIVPIGRELCSDAACFAVERVDKAPAGLETTYTLFWYLASNDRQREKRFPGRALEIFVYDERGRTFNLMTAAKQDPLDVLIPAGQTIRGVMQFSLPSDAQEAFLTAKYRPYTFQSLLPGELSLVRVSNSAVVQIQ